MAARNLLVYRASAGSGKTHNLVFAFLRLLLLADDPRTVRQALAITFTRKASMEMKERILKQLRYMAMEPATRTADQRSDAMETSLIQALECNQETLRNRSFQYLQHMLHRYNDTAISTIDSFITQLARPFYRELRTGLDFDIELDRDLVIEQALDEWMNNLGNDNQAVTDLLHFMAQNRNQKEQSWNTRTLLEKYAGFLFEDRTYAHLHQLLERSPESYQRHFDELEAKLQYHLDYTLQTAAKLAQEARDLGFEPDDFVQKSGGVLGHLEKLAGGAGGALHSNAQKALDERRVLQPKCTRPLPDSWVQEVMDFMKYRTDSAGEVELLSALLDMRYATTLMGSMYQHFMEFNRNQLRMPLNFMYFQMADLIRQTHPEYLCDRVGQRYQHVLIDEFQDTSLLQWQCLFPLADNAIASGGTALMVGDVKQSIYRWRNGDARLLASLPKDVLGNSISALWEGLFEAKFLRQNYRSFKNIIDFNNAFFGCLRLKHGDIADPFFVDVEQECSAKEPAGQALDGTVQVAVWDCEKTGVPLASERVRLCIEIIEAQLALEADGIPLYKPKDIAILVRTNKIGAEIASGLMAAGQAVISPDSLVLGLHPEVEKLITAWQFLHDSSSLLNQDLLFLALNPEQYKRGEQPHRLNEWLAQHFPLWNEDLLLQLPLGLQLHEIAYALGCPTQDAYVKRLLEEWTLQCAAGLGAQELRDWWKRNRLKIKLQIQDQGQAVTVLTVHSAKGLEFPVVILPELDRSRKLSVIEYQWLQADQDASLQTQEINAGQPLPIHLVSTSKLKKGPEHLQSIGKQEDLNNDLDYLNLLYVALTRAKSSMIIVTEKVKVTEKKSSNSGPLTFAKLFEEFKETPEGQGLVHRDHSAFESWTLGQPLSFLYEEKLLPQANLELIQRIPDTATPNPMTSLSPRLCMEQNLNWQSHWSDPVEAGALFHQVVAQLEEPKKHDLAIEEFMARPDLTLALKTKVRGWILEVLGRDDLRDCWDGSCKVLREMPLLMGDGQFLKPDMVLLRDDGTARVIEFKTGAVRESHLVQLNRYLTALRDAGIPAEGDVVYVGGAAA